SPRSLRPRRHSRAALRPASRSRRRPSRSYATHTPPCTPRPEARAVHRRSQAVDGAMSWRGPRRCGPLQARVMSQVVGRFSIRVAPIGTRAYLGGGLARLLRLLRVLLRDLLAFLGSPSVRIRLLAQLLRLLTPVLELPPPRMHCRERDQRQDDHDSDRD